jgi:DNA polymerase-3 subunit delta
MSASDLERFVPYLEEPLQSTCLIFISSQVDFKRKFYRKIGKLGSAVQFRELKDSQVVPWIMKTAKDLGLDMDSHACAYLQQIVGNQLRDLFVELEKLSIRYGTTAVGMEEVEQLAIYSRTYTIFELMDEVSSKRTVESLRVLKRFLEEEGKDAILRILGMLGRQMRLLWQTKAIVDRGGRPSDTAKALGLPIFLARKLLQQSQQWDADALEQVFQLLYKADGHIKAGSAGQLVLENLVLSICTSGGLIESRSHSPGD